jgi:hypothetical protein
LGDGKLSPNNNFPCSSILSATCSFLSNPYNYDASKCINLPFLSLFEI